MREGWERQPWIGNPEMVPHAAVRKFSDCKLWVWGTENNAHKLPPPADPDYIFGALNFTMSCGANSDRSYTGLCVNCFTIDDAIEYVEELNRKGKLVK
jgi:hypothetical protein